MIKVFVMLIMIKNSEILHAPSPVLADDNS